MALDIKIERTQRGFGADFGVVAGTITPYSVRFDVLVSANTASIHATSQTVKPGGKRGSAYSTEALVSSLKDGKLAYLVLRRDPWSFIDAKVGRNSLRIESEGYPNARMRISANNNIFLFEINNRIRIELEIPAGSVVPAVTQLGAAGIAAGLARDLLALVRPKTQIEEMAVVPRRIRA